MATLLHDTTDYTLMCTLSCQKKLDDITVTSWGLFSQTLWSWVTHVMNDKCNCSFINILKRFLDCLKPEIPRAQRSPVRFPALLTDTVHVSMQDMVWQTFRFLCKSPPNTKQQQQLRSPTPCSLEIGLAGLPWWSNMGTASHFLSFSGEDAVHRRQREGCWDVSP